MNMYNLKQIRVTCTFNNSAAFQLNEFVSWKHTKTTKTEFRLVGFDSASEQGMAQCDFLYNNLELKQSHEMSRLNSKLIPNIIQVPGAVQTGWVSVL